MSSFEDITALDNLFQSSARYRQSKSFIELLDFINRFPKLSPFNAFLIHMQNSGANFVLSQRKWKEFNREVRYSARPLVILVPFGPVEFVFDIADTDGDPVPTLALNPFYTFGNLSQNKFNTLVQNLAKENILIEEREMHKEMAGVATRRSSIDFTIIINSNMDVNIKFITLVHEVAHILCGHLGFKPGYKWPDRIGLPEAIIEIEAESIAYLVGKRLGLQPSSQSYLSNYIDDGTSSVLPNISLDLILTVTNQIERMVSKPYSPSLKDPKYKSPTG